jgi:hypothetical protein
MCVACVACNGRSCGCADSPEKKARDEALKHGYRIVQQGNRYAVQHDGDNIYASVSMKQCVWFLEGLFS